MKKTIATLLALTLTAGAVGARELRPGMAPPAKSPWGAVTQKFVDKVAELSGVLGVSSVQLCSER